MGLFFDLLYRLLIYPLELIFEVVYTLAEKQIRDPGLSIIVLSLVMNILVLPLYMKADRLQEEAREKESRLQPVIDKIKKTFKGDERFMMLNAYYRENDYSPLNSLKGSLSLLLEIPFFISAYHFLSNLGYIRGVSLGPLKDLGSPDGLIVIGGLTLNLLPVLMTLINLISSYIYAKDFPKKTKIQLYVIAGIFLVLLYNSPSGLVFYWILNNLFSLFKNVCYRFKDSSVVRKIRTAVDDIRRKDKKKIFSPEDPRKDKTIFILSSVFLAFITGILNTAILIGDNYYDLISLTSFVDPLIYFLETAAVSIGLFVVWAGIFYSLSGRYGKRLFSIIFWVMSASSVYNRVLALNSETGNFRPTLTFAYPLRYDDSMLIYLAILLSIIGLCYILWGNAKKMVIFVMYICVFVVTVLSVYHGSNIFRESAGLYITDRTRYAAPATLNFSREGKNVVVIMLDREVSEFVPAIMDEYPKISESFDGFTFYPNTLSLGNCTLVGTLGILGGYEYSPAEINKRTDEMLEDKINQANLMLPLYFKGKGFDVTVCDPCYAGKRIISDLSVFDEYDIDAYVTNGAFSYQYPDYEVNARDCNKRQERNFFFFGLLRASPVFLWDLIYDEGNYNSLSYESLDSSLLYDYNKFFDAFYTLKNLTAMTNVEETGDNYIYFSNTSTHEPVLLWEDRHDGKIISDGREYELDTDPQIFHYQVNASSLMEIAKWFDYLREEGVYDNTRIIIVSDHSTDIGYGSPLEEIKMENLVSSTQVFHCTLMMKDFDQHGQLKIDGSRMTNADVPILATEGFDDDPVNPITGNSLMAYKDSLDGITVMNIDDWNPEQHGDHIFTSSGMYHITGEDLMDRSNWEYIG